MAEAGNAQVVMETDKMDPDPWNPDLAKSNEKSWGERSDGEKTTWVLLQAGKVLCIFGLLYLFIISLGLMGNAFKIVGGPSAGAVFRNQNIFDNPIAGLVLGILATVLVQSSSTSTSIIITMTAAGLMEVQNAIYMIMGANIGTSVTNTIVSIGQIGNKDEYRRAFAGATVHDCFNLLSVAILLPVEVATGLLMHMAQGLVNAFGITDDQEKGTKVDFLKVITKPISSMLVQVDKKIVTKVAQETDPAELEKLMAKSMLVNSQDKSAHLFMDTPMNDTVAGVLLLVVSLVLLSTCLILLVKTLQSVFRGRAAIWMKGLLNLEFKSVPCIADYILIAFGAGITILMQSSSITTSTLTPLVGVGLVKLEKMFPFTVGANMGTTVTGILSALASSNIATGMTVAMSHLCFNLIGTLIWFPLPFMRRVPIAMARTLGNLAADLPWFPVFYTIMVFGVIPLVLFLLSLAGVVAVSIAGTIIILSIVLMIAVLALRQTRPSFLPASLRRDPAWMPASLRVVPLEGAGEQVSDAVSSADFKNSWWQGTLAWGTGWFVLMFLVMAVFNCQWGIIKYSKEDGRNHIGIGTWVACSKNFQDEVEYVTPAAANVTGDLPFEVSYGTAGDVSWEAGDHCRPVSDMCSNGATLAHSGNLGVAGLIFAVAGQVLLLAYVGRQDTRDMKQWLQGSFGCFVLCLLMLVASHANFTSSLGVGTTCTLMAPSNTGAMIAKGKFGDIVKASLSHTLVLYSWLLTLPVLAVIGHRLATSQAKPVRDETSELAETSEPAESAGVV